MITHPDNAEHSVVDTGRPLTIFESRKFVDRLKRYRIPVLLAGHLVAFCFIYWLAVFLRFERLFPANPMHLQVMPLIVLIKLAVFFFLKTLHGWWRYVTFSDFIALSKATAVSIAVFFLIDYLLIPEQISRGAVLIDGAFTIAIMGALRSAWRLWDERGLYFHTGSVRRKRALLVGADIESAKLAHLINSRSKLDYQISGLVSTTTEEPMRFSDLRVVGNISEINELCKLMRCKTVFVPSGELPAKKLRELIDMASVDEVQVHIVPSMMSLLEGGAQIPIRQVSFEDLLRRPPVSLDEEAIEGLVEGKTILVTGAGGSIGSELCRQLVKFSPKTLVLLGRGENRIYHIHRELSSQGGETELVMALATITDQRRMMQIIQEYKPEVVFHAAAHKHVPLTEVNIGEAVINNVYGTKVVADVCHEVGVERCVIISTDKAVNPTSVMGCTKQLAERYCLALGGESKTKFMVTRFGNVLGSAGSVVPLFKEQIQKGGPITVTDPRMTRFFMTIPEAAQLVVQAATMGHGGEIFVLEMGEPVKIVELAKDLIRLSGLPPNSIDIEFTGIRQGEKLYEELYYIDEKSLPTDHKKILTAYHRPFGYEETSTQINDLIDVAYSNPSAIRSELETMVPEFRGTSATDSSEASRAAEVQS